MPKSNVKRTLAVPKKAKKGRIGSRFKEIGYPGFKQSGGMVNEEFLTMLQGREGVRIYTEMAKNSAVVGAILMSMEQVMRQVTWSVEAASPDPEDIKAKDFLRSNMDDMEHTWDDFISDVLSFLTYGWSMFEKVYKIRKGRDVSNPSLKSDYDDGLIGWRKFAFRAQKSLERWEFSPRGDILGMWQRLDIEYSGTLSANRGGISAGGVRTGPIFLPIEKCIHFRTKPAGGNPEGSSVLRNAFVSWYRQKNIEEIEAIGIERDLVGLPKLTPPEDYDWEDPENAEMLSWARQLLANVRVDEYMGVLLPGPEWLFDIIGAGAGSAGKQISTNDVINRLSKMIAVSVMAQFIMLGMDRIGSFALGKAIQDLWLTAIDGYAKAIADCIHKFATKPLFELNPKFAGLKNLPRIKSSRVNVPSIEELSKMIKELSAAQILPEDPELLEEVLRVSRLPNTAFERQLLKDPSGEQMPKMVGDDMRAQQMSLQEKGLKVQEESNKKDEGDDDSNSGDDKGDSDNKKEKDDDE
jgi:hypothetical protein